MTDPTQAMQRRCAHCGTMVAPGIAFCANCGASLDIGAGDADALTTAVRALFGRDLEIEREIGRGGMAAVFAAFDPALHRRVAVKVLLPELAEDRDVAERFRREARTVAALQHPNIVSVYAVRSDAEMSAIVMQFVEGRSLDLALGGGERLPSHVAGLILGQVAEALQHAHERGVIHRDVKPANVLLDHDGRAVVSDFGIARREGGTRITDTGVVMGTVAYMSPEQCIGSAVTAASDQYSFGVMAYELLAGRRPFADGPVIEMLRAHLDDAPPNLAGIRPDLPAGVVAYVMRALAKDPAARHADLRGARETFASLVADAKSTTKIIATLALPVAPIAPIAAPAATVRIADEARGAASRRTAIVAAAAVVVFLGAAAAFWSYARGTPAAAPPPADASLAAAAPRVSAPSPATDASVSTAVPAPTTPTSPRPVKPSAEPSGPVTQAAASAPRDSVVRAPVAPSSAATAPASAPTSTPASAAEAPAPAPAKAAPVVSAALADARAVAREFVTICNQRRVHDLEQLGALDGDAALRAELLRLVRTAPDFAAGFDRVASSPALAGDRFTTDFVIDAEWRGGQLLATVKLQAAQQNGAWHVLAFGVSAAP